MQASEHENIHWATPTLSLFTGESEPRYMLCTLHWHIRIDWEMAFMEIWPCTLVQQDTNFPLVVRFQLRVESRNSYFHLDLYIWVVMWGLSSRKQWCGDLGHECSHILGAEFESDCVGHTHPSSEVVFFSFWNGCDITQLCRISYCVPVPCQTAGS